MKRQPGLARAIIFAFVATLASAAPYAMTESASRPIRLVALGDSLMAGYNLPENASFPAVLEKALRAKGHNVEIANASVSGDTSTGGLERLDWSVPDGTDGVIVELGANDMLRGLDPAITRRAIETIVERLRARNIPVMLAGMFASRNLGADYVRRFDSLYRDIAEKYGVVLYPFFLDGIVGDRALNLPDGVHPSAKGVEVIAERILPTVESFLGRIQQR
jgi:acyl-CoA thioesterase I